MSYKLLVLCNHRQFTGQVWLVGNCEEELPKKPVGRLSVNCQLSDRQVTDSLPTANQQVKKKEKLW